MKIVSIVGARPQLARPAPIAGTFAKTEHPAGSPVRRSRGRVVMLVDNGVDGDSRVQKAARSAADAGWDVILLGNARGGGPRTWHLGGAEVRLIPTPIPMARRLHEYRRAWVRRPFGYPPGGVAEYRRQWVKAWRADLDMRTALLKLDRPALRRSGVGRIRLAARALRLSGTWRLHSLVRRWVGFRYRSMETARTSRHRLDAPWNRAYTALVLKLMGERAWRRLEPRVWDFELAYGKVIDDLRPDLIHAHDFYMLGVGARAAVRARANGRPVKLVWDAHEYLPGLNPATNSRRFLPAICAYEREFARHADAVVTVSESLAELLKADHRLAELPTVVLNAPTVAADEADATEPPPDLRGLCGVEATTPLLAYSGGIAPVRGVDVIVDALVRLPDAHVALVSLPPGKASSPHIKALRARASHLGVADRVHLLPYVSHRHVARFLSAADVGVSPILHLPNHEIALSNKFFEYAHARLPVVVSDVRTMAEATRRIGHGEVFRAGDVDEFVRAVSSVLADPQRYRAAYDRPGLLADWTWEAQAERLDGVYSRLLPAEPERWSEVKQLVIGG